MNLSKHSIDSVNTYVLSVASKYHQLNQVLSETKHLFIK